jgi:tartrate dehydratase alpha subunit/fumarate hydratase class I-like protein
MVVSEITYNVLKSKYGEQDAQTIVEGIRQTVKEEVDNKKDVIATKEDMERNFRDNLKWNIGLIVGLFISLLGAITGIIKLTLH